tara:strand:+ start:38 stop:307 length:270 start_codon:yes stop_codon:yes gene_type:complete
MKDTFRKSVLDSKKLRASDNTIMMGQTYMHSKNNRLYVVEDIIWNGDTDEWSILHSRDGTTTRFVRSLSNFNGCFEGTEQRRFIQVKED